MRKAIRIGRLFGIDLRIDSSWLFIFAVVTWSLTSVFGNWHPDWTKVTRLVVAVIASLMFFASVLAHELAHALVARGYKLPVRDITLHMFGGVSNIERGPPTPGAELAIAIVGPIASIAIGAAMLAATMLFAGLTGPLAVTAENAQELAAHMGPVTTLLMWLGPVNITVGLFNLVPGFPLDGGRVLRAAIWKATGDLHKATHAAATIGRGMGWAFIAAGAAMALGRRLPFFGTGLASGLWLALIGMFLRNAALQEEVGSEVTDLLEGVEVADLMRPIPLFASHGMTAAPSDDMRDALRRMAENGVRELAVVDERGSVIGMLFEQDIARWLGMRAATTPKTS